MTRMEGGATGPVTVGIDIGTTAVKALAVTADGTVLARCRVPHRLLAEDAERLEHDAGQAWRRGPRRALAAVATGLDVAGVCVAAMVPSMVPVDRRGMPRGPGLLYGDRRAGSGALLPDLAALVGWAAAEAPDAAGYWPAQAVAGVALGGEAAVDTAVVGGSQGLVRAGSWDPDVLAALGARVEQLPAIVPMGQPAGRSVVGGEGGPAVMAAGTVDALCEQVVAGADAVGDVLVVAGATLVVWVVTDRWVEVPDLWSVPHTTAGRVLVGGPSNAGALFVDWARRLGGLRPGRPVDVELPADPAAVPVWLPYPRGERVPLHDPGRRAALVDLDVAHGPAAWHRAVHEASGFVVRQLVERSGIAARRVVVSGGLARSRAWSQAMADAVGVPVDTVAVPEGGALGAAYVARMAAGLAESLDGARSWARTGARIEPDPRWQEATAARYARFASLSATPF